MVSPLHPRWSASRGDREQRDGTLRSIGVLAPVLLHQHHREPRTIGIRHVRNGARIRLVLTEIIFSKMYIGLPKITEVFDLMASCNFSLVSFYAQYYRDNRVGWASKRWPHYSELASRLIGAGYRVASFGMEQEYVEGTENMTGGTIEEMVHKMRACSYFIGNDSGVMHLSNSLGIPTMALFAPTNALTRGPLRLSSRSVVLEKACVPCECKDRRAQIKRALNELLGSEIVEEKSYAKY